MTAKSPRNSASSRRAVIGDRPGVTLPGLRIFLDVAQGKDTGVLESHLKREIGRSVAMTTFEEREQAYEAKLAHDEELKFKALARRNKWLGLWAAEKLGKHGAAAEEYAAAL